jgi:uncharacterized membrane-anchored protein YitT (DUF2179 family)
MSVNTVLTLLEYVMLAVPAIGIYMQIQYDIGKPNPGDDIQQNHGQSRMGYQLGKASIIPHLVAGGFLVAWLLAKQPPTVLPSWASSLLLTALIYGAILSIGVGIYLFGSAAMYGNVIAPQTSTKQAVLIHLDNRIPWVNLYERQPTNAAHPDHPSNQDTGNGRN